MLKNKNAIVYGASPSLGGAVALEFAEAGAKVFVTHRRLEAAKEIAEKIIENGGKAEAAEVDALNEQAVNDFIDSVVSKAGSIDISFNLIGWKDTQDIPLIKMESEDFVRPIKIAMLSQFITATAAGRMMSKKGSGVILSLTATPGGIGYPMVGGFGPACCAIEALSKNLASELGPSGVRVVNIRSAGSPDSRPFKEALAVGGEEVSEFFDKIKEDTMLKDLPLMKDIAQAAVFLSSNMAKRITGVTIDVTAGTTSALNYKVPKIPFGN